MGIEDRGNPGAYHDLLTSEGIWILVGLGILSFTYLNVTCADEM